MSAYRGNPRRPAPNRTAEILTISLLVGLIVLLGVAGMLWLTQGRPLFVPTPTPTATVTARATATPDFRATRVMEDMLTQVAYSATVIQRQIAMGTLEPLPVLTTNTPANIFVPSIRDGETPAAVAFTPTATPNTISLPFSPNSPLPTPTPLVPPTAMLEPPTATVVVEITVEPTLTFTPLPPTQTPIPTIYFVNTLRARVVREAGVVLRLGPSNVYAEAGSLPVNTQVNLLGRDATGEWVYVCCLGNDPRWARQAYVQAFDNLLATAAPTSINPNDVRWLPLQPLASDATPVLTPTPIPANDYPIVRHDPTNRARVPRIPRLPLDNAWPSLGLAGGAFTSPVVVAGESVLVASADGHLYSFGRTAGNQRWRYLVGPPMRFAPVVQDTTIYLVDDDGRIMALQDLGGQASVVWQNTLPQPPSSGFTVVGSKLYVSTMSGGTHQVLAVNRGNGGIESAKFDTTGNYLHAPAVGNQLLYVGDSSLWALDLENFEQVWTRPEIQNVVTAPVYSANGVVAFAEVYVADSVGHIYSLDANTGVQLWRYDGTEPITALALNDTTVFASGNGYVRAIARNKEHRELWRVGVNGVVPGGPLVDSEVVLIVTATGDIQYLDAITGGLTNAPALVATTLSGGAAVSGNYLFMAGTNNNLYALRDVQ